MPTLAGSSDWTILGDLFIRNVKLYDGINLPISPGCMLASCPFGGPIAIGLPQTQGSHPTNKTVTVSSWKIVICSANGKLLFGSIQTSAISHMFWSKCQKLILVGPGGRILLYDAIGKLQNVFDMGKETQTLGLSQAKCFFNPKDTGLAVMNTAYHIFAINSIDNPVPWKIHDCERRSEPPTCWTVLSSLLKPTSVLVCAKVKFYLGILESTAEHCHFDWSFTSGSYVAMETNGLRNEINSPMLLCLLHDSGVIQIISDDLRTALNSIEFSPSLLPNIDNAIHPLWCGDCAIAIQTSAQSLQFFGINDAKYTHNEDMVTAVDECLFTSAHHFDPVVQKFVLRAASMGMTLCDRYERENFVRVTRLLRVANAVRRLGLAISFAELEELTIYSLINRLIALKQWPLAMKICGLMNVDKEDGLLKVLASWCLALMKECTVARDGTQSKITEEMASKKIFDRLEPYQHGISYADIADMAAKNGLHALAELLLDREPNLSRQVDVLLRLKQVDKALKIADQSQQPDLLHTVLRHLRSLSNPSEVELMLGKIPNAMSLYQSCMHEEAPDKLLMLYIQNDDFARQAIYYLNKAQDYGTELGPFVDHDRRIEYLAKAEEALRQMKDTSAAQIVATSSQLLAENVKNEEKYSVVLTDKPLREAFIWAIGNTDENVVEGLRKQHRLSDKQYWFWSIEGLAKAAKWQQLEKFGRSPKKSPIGYLPLIEVCCRYGNNNLAARFMDKIGGYEEQVKAFLLLGKISDAADIAAKKGDVSTLFQIRRRLPHNSDPWKEVSRIIQSVQDQG
ncbi:vacuolar protein sorting-associated protein 16 like protein [Ditylenchus destructor]|uniref:Vacuolar protein sorting-associated protein 16 homolog n=1 Tax=Ditylenchus destructor TaxID=166010 RepID=A0AAD4NEU0_9BILA|nr:vacuolar protein sorting-associated protein 16 like protein [Ditylenchus destructor]